MTLKLVYLDFETTGLSPENDYPTEIGILVDYPWSAKPQETYNSLIQLPEGVEISDFITGLTGLTTEKVNSEGKPVEVVTEEIKPFFSEDGYDLVVIAQSANFDLGFLQYHFGIGDLDFVDTKSVAFLTRPDQKNSLQDLHRVFCPEKTIEQTHRALDDCYMTMDVFNAWLDDESFDPDHYLNLIVIPPDRPLVYYPDNARFLDFSKLFMTKKAHEKELAEYKEDAGKYQYLDAHGVDNWGGYGDAITEFYEDRDAGILE